MKMKIYFSLRNHPNCDELPVISLLENNHLLKPNSIELTIGQVCLLGRAPAGRSSNIDDMSLSRVDLAQKKTTRHRHFQPRSRRV